MAGRKITGGMTFFWGDDNRGVLPELGVAFGNDYVGTGGVFHYRHGSTGSTGDKPHTADAADIEAIGLSPELILSLPFKVAESMGFYPGFRARGGIGGEAIWKTNYYTPTREPTVKPTGTEFRVSPAGRLFVGMLFDGKDEGVEAEIGVLLIFNSEAQKASVPVTLGPSARICIPF